ncbi:MAG TPA: CoA-transferase [Candidatus Limnocylindrales bacterium]|nr:CoA-transferase [Candidatus Limnocylindrales bacterium]
MWTISDIMAVSMARLLRNGETVFHGVASPLPMVAILLAKKLHAPDLIYINITGGIDPEPARLPHSTVHPELFKGSAIIFSLQDLFDLAARGDLDVAFLGGAQIDQHGRTNMTAIGSRQHPKIRLPGSAGSASIMPVVKRVILWRTRHDRKTFVERCDFITADGRVERVVTPLCIFKKVDNILQVESIHPHASREEVLANTGFEVRFLPDFHITPEPTPEELKWLSEIDPHRVRDIEFS